jgi:hypothetical protein
MEDSFRLVICQVIIGDASKPSSTTIVIAFGLFLVGGSVLHNRRSTSQELLFDASYTAPKDWQLVEDGKWGIQLKVPPSSRDSTERFELDP